LFDANVVEVVRLIDVVVVVAVDAVVVECDVVDGDAVVVVVAAVDGYYNLGFVACFQL